MHGIKSTALPQSNQTPIMKFIFLILVLKIFVANSQIIPQFEVELKSFKCKTYDPKIIASANCSFTKSPTKSFLIPTIQIALVKDLNKPLYVQIIVGRKSRENYYQTFLKTDLIEVEPFLNLEFAIIF